MKPARSPQTTGLLPSRATSALTSSSTSGSVTTVRMISTRFCTGAGLKKWTPITRPGCGLAVEISVTLRLEVLVARIVSGFTMPSSSRKIDFLISIDSTTASTTKSASARSFIDVVENVTRPSSACLVLRAQLAARHGAAGRVLQVLATALDGLVVDLDADHREPVAGEHLGDAGAHGAQADHADRGELATGVGRGGLRAAARHGADPPMQPRRPTARWHPRPDPSSWVVMAHGSKFVGLNDDSGLDMPTWNTMCVGQ